MNSKGFETAYFQAIKIAKFCDFTIWIIKKQNRKDFAGLI